MVSVYVIFWGVFILLDFLHFAGVFYRTILPRPLDGYEMIVADPADKCEPTTSSSAMRDVSQFIIVNTLIKLK